MSIDGTLGILEDLNVAVPMRDGVTLRGNLWRPAAGGPFPALLMRTPYGKPAVPNLRYLRAGYAVMTQDSRGRYASDGDFTVFSEPTHDSEDGYDTVEWLAAQPWCNGRIGTFGASYCGWMQWMTAKARPPHLVAMCARSIPLELTDIDWPGAFKLARRISRSPAAPNSSCMPPPAPPIRTSSPGSLTSGPTGRLSRSARAWCAHGIATASTARSSSRPARSSSTASASDRPRAGFAAAAASGSISPAATSRTSTAITTRAGMTSSTRSSR
ncbi:MAG: CocE/NonD family hydrolase [Lentisphaerae bacterium]|nr:CocE/NonD family hydrolase [Lentisphaerota bacterium]